MKEALVLARKGFGRTWPNPCVGALLVKDGRVVGRGFHKGFGLAHAEIDALEDAGNNANGATLYVTLEPCCHHGMTGPCADALVRAGIVKVVCAMKDPNPLINGRGIVRLRASGIEVTCGLMEKESRLLNRPRVILKTACTVDFKIADRNGRSKWITGSEARRYSRRLRANSDAILTGVGTVLADNPALSARTRPLRIILDSRLRTPLSAKVLRDQNVLLVGDGRLSDFEVLNISKLDDLLSTLWWRGIKSVFVEAGNKVNTSFIEAGFVDEFIIFMNPTKFFPGGLNAFNIELPTSFSLSSKSIGSDLLFHLTKKLPA